MLHQLKSGWRNFTKVVSRIVTSTFQVGSCSKWENLTKSKPKTPLQLKPLVSFMCARPVWYLLPKKLDKQRPDWNHYLDKINIHLSLLHTKNGSSVQYIEVSDRKVHLEWNTALTGMAGRLLGMVHVKVDGCPLKWGRFHCYPWCKNLRSFSWSTTYSTPATVTTWDKSRFRTIEGYLLVLNQLEWW